MGKESSGLDNAPYTKENNEKDQIPLKKVEIDSNINEQLQDKLDVHIDHSKCNSEANDNGVDIKTEENRGMS